MSNNETTGEPLDVVLGLRAADAPQIPAELVTRVFEIEREAQFDSDRAPATALLREAIEQRCQAEGEDG